MPLSLHPLFGNEDWPLVSISADILGAFCQSHSVLNILYPSCLGCKANHMQHFDLFVSSPYFSRSFIPLTMSLPSGV